MTEWLKEISDCIFRGDASAIVGATEQVLAEGLSAQRILEEGLLPGMDRVGTLFRDGEMFIPEVLQSARAMHASMGILKPLFAESGIGLRGVLLIGTVQGDLHDIGKNLVAMMVEGAGFEVVDLGVDVTPERFVQEVRERKPDLIGMSALLTTTMRAMGETIEALEGADLRDRVKIMVGGAAVTSKFAEEIGADGYGANAVEAAALAKSWVGSK